MAALLFPDNTVLVNFGLIDRVDLFAELAAGRGAWTHTIAEECARSSRQEGLEALARMPRILGDPLVPTQRERIDMQMLRSELAVPGDPPSRHLGEAEAIAIISARSLSAAFVTDDLGARQVAARFSIQVYSTGDLLRLAVKARRLDHESGWGLAVQLRGLERRVPGMPGDRGHYDYWVTN